MTDTQKKPTNDMPDQAITKVDLSSLSKVKVAGELDLLTAAKAFAASGMFPDVKSQSQAVVKIVAGYELGVKPFAAMRGIHFITFKTKDENDRWVERGVLELSANLRAALLKKSGRYDYRVRELDSKHCKIEFFEKDPNGERFESVGFSEYSTEQAHTAGIDADRGSKKSNWILYPEDMCFAAAMRKGCKRFAPDVFVGEDAIDDATAATQVAAHEIDTPADEPVEAELVEEEGAREGPQPDPEPAAPSAAPSSSNDAAALEPEADAAPSEPSASARDEGPTAVASQPAPEGTRVGMLFVPRRGKGPWLATEAKQMRTKDQCERAEKLLETKLSMVKSALAPTCMAMFGVALTQASKTALDELIAFLEAKASGRDYEPVVADESTEPDPERPLE